MADDRGYSKGRRAVPDGPVHISDLPDALLSGVATYLPAPSRVLFAVAMAAPPTTTAILSTGQWEALDFADIEKSLASRLTDDDIGSMLSSIDAANTLKRLKLAGCVNITGSGLECLRGSTTLEQIDLSLVGLHERPAIEPEPTLSEEVVYPILTSIVDADGNSLKHVELPKMHRIGTTISAVDQFVRGYSGLLRNRRHACSNCRRTEEGSPLQYNAVKCPSSGLQKNTCCICLEATCNMCSDMQGEGVKKCPLCERYRCASCAGSRKQCYGSKCEGNNYVCEDCGDYTKCPQCESPCACSNDCLYSCVGCSKSMCDVCTRLFCENGNCHRAICTTCDRETFAHLHDFCERCDKGICTQCLASTYDESGVDCPDCSRRAGR